MDSGFGLGKEEGRRWETAQNKFLKESDLTFFSLKRRKEERIKEFQRNKCRSRKGDGCVYTILTNRCACRSPSTNTTATGSNCPLGQACPLLAQLPLRHTVPDLHPHSGLAGEKVHTHTQTECPQASCPDGNLGTHALPVLDKKEDIVGSHLLFLFGGFYPKLLTLGSEPTDVSHTRGPTQTHQLQCLAWAARQCRQPAALGGDAPLTPSKP